MSGYYYYESEDELKELLVIKKEKEFLTKLINDHWKYIEGVITKAVETYTNQIDESALKEIEYHYKTAFEHGWRHAKEYFTGSV